MPERLIRKARTVILDDRRKARSFDFDRQNDRRPRVASRVRQQIADASLDNVRIDADRCRQTVRNGIGALSAFRRQSARRFSQPRCKLRYIDIHSLDLAIVQPSQIAHVFNIAFDAFGLPLRRSGHRLDLIG